ncbi:Crp/Fnr family transcriptional regulator [Methylocystis parvus]|uniref:Crp/Fnr family transcriptional regulator n=2 Tax=Methylocystis parvus TaxID=134 RepID=A0A6B8MBG3_9HYPH|nr:Crp/Fnr family transcriptional regulator [Methylocystis parvus]
MTRMSKAKADRILSGAGWLSEQPEAFRAEVLQRSKLLRYAPGDVVFRLGDPIGGIYGLVDGTVAANIAPPMSIPRLIHLGAPGHWTGEGCFFTRHPRRGELRAIVETWMMHLPLEAMDQIAALDPQAARHFAQILMVTFTTLVRVIHDLQKPEATRRIASVLNRATWIGDRPIPLSQAEFGAMANASRKQVNAALQCFAAEGWLTHTYRSITIVNAEALRLFAEKEDES